MRNGLRFGLLGPPVLYDPDGEVGSVGGGKMRALLTALLLEPGRVVSVDVLKDALWGGAPPASAQASLQNHVTRLRRLLDDPERLRAVPPGYVLRVGEDEFDVRVFERHATLARDAHAERDWERALRESTAALALWRGTPLSGLPPETGGHAFVQRLEEARLLVLEWRYEAELCLAPTASRLDRLAPELAARTAEHPLRESFHRLLMLVLHRDGRQAEALAVHRDLRARLLDELGVEPGPAVRRAHLEILRDSDPAAGGPYTDDRILAGTRAGVGTGVGAEDGLRARAGNPGSDRSGDGTRPGYGTSGRSPDRARDGVGARNRGWGRDRDGLGEQDPNREQDLDRTWHGNRDAERGPDEGGDGDRDPDPGLGGDRGRSGGRDGDGGAAEAVPGSDRGDRDAPAPPRPAQLPPPPAYFTGREDARERLRQILDPERSERLTPPEIPARPDGEVNGTPTEGVPADVPADTSGGVSGRTAGGTSGGPSGDGPTTAGAGAGARVGVGGGVNAATAAWAAVGTVDEAHGASRGRLPGGDPTTGVPRVAVISGMAGVGKSALALHVAHGLRERFTDGQLYVNLHGATPGMTPLTAGQALAALLRDLGAEPRRIPEHPDAAAALLRSMLAPTRTLMVLDDAAHAAQVRPLLPAGAGCAVIVTSRSPLTALDGATRFPLAPLTDEDSAALLRAVSGRQDGLDGGHPLVELTGRLPLALRVVAARLAARHALTPDVLAGQLAATEGRLHHLEYDDLSVRRSLAVAHDALRASEREADRDAALALCRIGALDLPVYGAALVARLAGTDERRAEAALDRLVDVALLEETAYGRYAPHDLVRDFAREIAGAAECVLTTATARATATATATAGAGSGVGVDTGAGTDDGTGTGAGTGDGTGTGGGAGASTAAGGHDAVVAERALRWYAGVAARSLEAILEPGLDREDRGRPTASQPAGHTVDVAATPPFCSAREAFAWGDTELANVVALAERYAQSSPYVPVLARMLNPYVQRSGRVAELEVLQRAALGTARLLGDEAAEAFALGDLGGLHFMTGRVGEALTLNDEALAIWCRLGVPSCMRRGLNNRGMLLESLGRYAESSEALLQSLQFSRELGDPHMEAITYSHLGNLYEHTDPRAAIDHHKRSLAIGDAVQDVIIRHSAHCNIGYAHLTLGEPAAAVPHFEESLRVLGSHGDWHGESQTRLGLVRALRGVGQWERAARECDLLRCRADRRADRYTGGLARHQRGLLLRERGDAEAAYQEWTAALEALEETDSPVTGELRLLLAK
jgi:DNA-binding SARP family transcriptional activator/tetratricopeptide (TPR) repeat protein